MNTKLAAIALGLATLSTSALAQTYYTIDVANDALYTINPTTGVATFKGNFMYDIDGVDMAWHQGALYAKTFNSVAGTRVWQVLTTGMYAGLGIGGSAINGGGYQGAEIAGLASDGTNLYVTYSNQPPTNNYSTSFGRINPLTGTITFLGSINTDADAMCYTGNQFWTMDVIAPGSGYQVYRGAAIPNVFVGGDTYDNSLATNPVDMEFYSPTQLVTVGQTGKNLVRIWRNTGKRASVVPITGAPANAVFKGIAYQPPCVSWDYLHNPN
jgi:hypothetical protein